jgi:hypothetical protein
MASTLSSSTPNSLIRGETAAVETYEQAMAAFEDFEDLTIRADLQRIRGQHQSAITQLREFVRDMNDKPAEGSGVWGYWASLYTGTAKLMGDQSTLSALRTGEEHGIAQYESALDDDSVSAIRQTLLPQCRRHVDMLTSIINRLENS